MADEGQKPGARPLTVFPFTVHHFPDFIAVGDWESMNELKVNE